MRPEVVRRSMMLHRSRLSRSHRLPSQWTQTTNTHGSLVPPAQPPSTPRQRQIRHRPICSPHRFQGNCTHRPDRHHQLPYQRRTRHPPRPGWEPTDRPATATTYPPSGTGRLRAKVLNSLSRPATYASWLSTTAPCTNQAITQLENQLVGWTMPTLWPPATQTFDRRHQAQPVATAVPKPSGPNCRVAGTAGAAAHAFRITGPMSASKCSKPPIWHSPDCHRYGGIVNSLRD